MVIFFGNFLKPSDVSFLFSNIFFWIFAPFSICKSGAVWQFFAAWVSFHWGRIGCRKSDLLLVCCCIGLFWVFVDFLFHGRVHFAESW
jgi:hypothetical protein